jgi:hypothetical protein
MSVESGFIASENGSAASEQHAAPAGPAAALELVRSRPEVLVGAAFAGGVIAAILLRRLGH